MAKTLEDLILADEVVLPEYLVVKTNANEFRHITHGQEVFHVKDHMIYNMANDKDGHLVDNKVVLDLEDDFVDYIASESKQPYVGLSNPVRVELSDFEKEDLDRQVLIYFKKFVEGRFDFGPIVYATDVIDGGAGDVVEPEAPKDVKVEPGTTDAKVTAK